MNINVFRTVISLGSTVHTAVWMMNSRGWSDLAHFDWWFLRLTPLFIRILYPLHVHTTEVVVHTLHRTSQPTELFFRFFSLFAPNYHHRWSSCLFMASCWLHFSNFFYSRSWVRWLLAVLLVLSLLCSVCCSWDLIRLSQWRWRLAYNKHHSSRLAGASLTTTQSYSTSKIVKRKKHQLRDSENTQSESESLKIKILVKRFMIMLVLRSRTWAIFDHRMPIQSSERSTQLEWHDKLAVESSGSAGVLFFGHARARVPSRWEVENFSSPSRFSFSKFLWSHISLTRVS